MYTYHHTSKARITQFGALLIFLLGGIVALWIFGYQLASDNFSLQISLFSTATGLVSCAALGLSIGIVGLFRFIKHNPTLVLTDANIMLSGYTIPVTDNWAQAVAWNDISHAKIIKEIVTTPQGKKVPQSWALTLYRKDEPSKSIGVIPNFKNFENSDEVVRLIKKKLGQQVIPIIEESASTIEESTPTIEPKTTTVHQTAINYRTCLKCHHSNPKDASVCESCGAKLYKSRPT